MPATRRSLIKEVRGEAEEIGQFRKETDSPLSIQVIATFKPFLLIRRA